MYTKYSEKCLKCLEKQSFMYFLTIFSKFLNSGRNSGIFLFFPEKFNFTIRIQRLNIPLNSLTI